MEKPIQPAKDLVAEVYGQGIRSLATWVWRSVTVGVASINGFLINAWIPERLLQNTQSPDVIANVTMIAWMWGVPFFVVSALGCGALLRVSSGFAKGVPHVEIHGLRRLYAFLHVMSSAIVTGILGIFLSDVLRGPDGAFPSGFWITLLAVAISYSIVYVFIAAWLLPRSIRVATAYRMLRAPLVTLGF